MDALPPFQTLRALFEGYPTSQIVVDRSLRVRYANPAAARDFAVPLDELVGKSIATFLPQHIADIRAHFEASTPVASRRSTLPPDGLVAYRGDGSAFPSRVGLTPIPDGDGILLGVSVRDVSKDSQRLVDRLTGLPNRNALIEAINSRIEERPRDPFAVFKVFMRRIHEVNVTFGFAAGDEAKRQFYGRLGEILGPRAYVARVETNIFGAIVPVQPPWGGNFHGLATAVAAAFDEPLTVRGEPITVEATVGMSFYPGHARDAEFLLRCATIAGEVAEQDPTGVAVWDPRRDEMSVNHLGMLTNLRGALEAGSLTLHYQPLVDLESRGMVGAEALIRWSGEDVMPSYFIPLAERTGLIRRIDQWVLDSSVQQLAAWGAEGHAFPVHINVSALTFQDPRFPERVAQSLSLWGVPAGRLGIEITETATMANPARAVVACGELRDLGCPLAIDDFGTGYSSLAYLNQMKVSSLKIDRSFVTSASKQAERLGLLQSMLDIGRRLELSTVVEGIEDEETAHLVKSVGGAVGQGYHFARPAPASELIRRFREGPF